MGVDLHLDLDGDTVHAVPGPEGFPEQAVVTDKVLYDLWNKKGFLHPVIMGKRRLIFDTGRGDYISYIVMQYDATAHAYVISRIPTGVDLSLEVEDPFEPPPKKKATNRRLRKRGMF